MIIETTNLHRRYGKVEVLKNVCLQVPEFSAFALVGTNGAGKTTTMRTLLNIIQPSSGSVSVLGIDSRALEYQDFLQIGYVSENQKLPARLTIDQYFRYLRSLYSNWDRALEEALRKKMELPPRRQLDKLSHGMRMKTLLVAALSFRPKLLILDEPLSGLDSLVRDEVVEGLLDQAHETTILISSHELAEIEGFTTNVAFMDKGRILIQESIETLRARFRTLHVTLSAEKSLHGDYPAGWLGIDISGHTMTLVETDFEDEQTSYQRLVSHFGAVQFRAEPMSLREISKTMILAGRGEPNQ